MANYYYDFTLGNEGNNGLSPTAPWKYSPGMGSSTSGGILAAGDSCNGKRGEQWREQLTVPSSGSAGSPITFGVYGTGDTPIIDGLISSNPSWTPEQITSYNKLPFTEEFANAQWNKYLCSISSDSILGPFGRYADGIIPNAGADYHNVLRLNGVQGLSASTTYTFSIYAKKGTWNFILLNINWYNASWGSLGNSFAFFNLNTGAIGITSNVDNVIIEPIDNRMPVVSGFYRVSITKQSPVGTANADAQIFPTSADGLWNPTGDGTSITTHITGAQWETASSPTYYVRNTTETQYTAYYASSEVPVKHIKADDSVLSSAVAKDRIGVSYFWHDSGNNRVYARMSGDDDPSGYANIDLSALIYGIYINGKSNIDIQNIDVKYCYQGLLAYSPSTPMANINILGGDYSYNGYQGIVYQNDSDYITGGTIFGVTAHHNGGTGILGNWGARNITVDNCIAYYNGAAENASAGIRFYGGTGPNAGAGDNIIQRCLAYSNLKNPLAEEGGRGIFFDSPGDGSIIRFNLSRNNYEGIFVCSPITTSDANGPKVYYNITHDNTNDGIVIYLWNLPGGTNKASFVFNNVSLNNGRAGITICGDGIVTVSNHQVKNNISIGNLRQLLAYNGGQNDGVKGSGNIYEYNCFGPESSNFIEWGWGVYKSTYAAWETAYGGSTYSVKFDPLFIDPANGNFRLQAASPCRDAGTDVGLTQDYEGNVVPWGDGVDIGAFEYWEEIIEQKKFKRRREDSSLTTAACFPINP